LNALNALNAYRQQVDWSSSDTWNQQTYDTLLARAQTFGKLQDVGKFSNDQTIAAYV